MPPVRKRRTGRRRNGTNFWNNYTLRSHFLFDCLRMRLSPQNFKRRKFFFSNKKPHTERKWCHDRCDSLNKSCTRTAALVCLLVLGRIVVDGRWCVSHRRNGQKSFFLLSDPPEVVVFKVLYPLLLFFTFYKEMWTNSIRQAEWGGCNQTRIAACGFFFVI